MGTISKRKRRSFLPASSQLRYAAAYILITAAALFLLNLYASTTIRSVTFHAQADSLESKAQLLSNALKYTGQDGTVRIYREGDDLCIRDSGMGIAPEDLPRVFDMGYTGQNGRLDRRSSGIGLYLCRRICRNLRHEIRIESVPGVGTTVYLTLGRGDFLPE